MAGLERPVKWIVAAVALTAALALAGFHPLSPTAAIGGTLAWGALVFFVPGLWLVGVPALLPVMNFSPWSGWFTFEEYDLLLLATIAGGWLRWAGDRAVAGAPRASPAVRLLLLALVLWNGLAFLRGWAGAGEVRFDWFGAYDNAMNSLRLFKSMFLAAFLFPLFRRELQMRGKRAETLFAWGLVAGLTVEVAAMLWERAAYVGLIDFSSRYRAVGLFWEMHVGGAAIDAYLVLCLPFALWCLFRAQTRGVWSVLAMVVLAGGYACLATFSRGVYLALAVQLAWLAFMVFRRGGPLEGRRAMALRWLAGGLGTALFFLLALVSLGYGGLLGAFAIVLILAVFVHPTRQALQLSGWREKGLMAVLLLFLLETVAVGAGGTFMLGRLSTSNKDLGGRFEHWMHAVRLLDSPEKMLLGVGLGRSPVQRVQSGSGEEFPGSFVVRQENGGAFARLTGPVEGRLAGLFGLSQRLRIKESGGIRVDADVRFSSDVDFYIKVCEKHLLYEIRCVSSVVPLINSAPGWQRISLPLEGAFAEPAGVLPRHSFLTLSVLGASQVLDVDNLRLIDSDGVQMLANGDFSAGGARWFMTGTSYFLPWHIDNLALEVVVENGLIGAALLIGGLALLFARWRENNLFMSCLTASIIGLLAVGMFGSILDVPRVAGCLYWIAAFGICHKIYAIHNSKTLINSKS